MSSVLSRVSKRIRMTADKFCSDCHFSLYYACLRVADELGGRLGMSSLSARAHERKDQWITNYLKNELQPVLDKYADDCGLGMYRQDAPIWLCWWTGEETAPPLVKKCIKSIRKNAGTHPVNLITQDNYNDYLTIPDYILEKMQNGTMCIANFSDYLRFSLLAKYGGLWLDATIYCNEKIREDYFSAPVFSCKGTLGDTDGYISRYRWTSFCFGGYKDNVLFRYMKDSFDSYWKANNASIDYLLVDYLIDLGFREIPQIRQCLNEISENNLHRDDLQAAMNAALPAEALKVVLQPDTALYKLSWRESYQEKTADGEKSIYARFLEQEI